MNSKQLELLNELKRQGCTGSLVSRFQITQAQEALGKSPSVPAWILKDPLRRGALRGMFLIPELGGGYSLPAYTPTSNRSPGKTKTAPVKAFKPEPQAPLENVVPVVGAAPMTADSVLAYTGGTGDLIPERMVGYVNFGHHETVEAIVRSGIFYTAFISGLSGNGKTTMVEQICAKLGREFFRVNVTSQTDEDDLLGGYRLVGGATVWQDGPVIAAMKRGAILLLDEIDQASHAIMCLQPVLEGKGVFLKKINQWVRPAQGFNVLATANTKGRGDETGRFVSSNVLNEAFLDRFAICLEQDYPAQATELKILKAHAKALGVSDTGFLEYLSTWTFQIRHAYKEQAVDDIITTRRALNIVTAYSIFGNRMKALEMGIARFGDETKEAFLSFYTKIDPNPNIVTLGENLLGSPSGDPCQDDPGTIDSPADPSEAHALRLEAEFSLAHASSS